MGGVWRPDAGEPPERVTGGGKRSFAVEKQPLGASVRPHATVRLTQLSEPGSAPGRRETDERARKKPSAMSGEDGTRRQVEPERGFLLRGASQEVLSGTGDP